MGATHDNEEFEYLVPMMKMKCKDSCIQTGMVLKPRVEGTEVAEGTNKDIWTFEFGLDYTRARADADRERDQAIDDLLLANKSLGEHMVELKKTKDELEAE